MKRLHFLLLALFASFASTGCLAVEKRTQVFVIPANSREIHAYEVLEGIGVADVKHPQLEQAKAEINALKEASFNCIELTIQKDSPLRKVCRFENTRFFLQPNPAHKRLLCMERGFTITDRDQFFKLVNQSISASFGDGIQQSSDQEMLDQIRELHAKLAKARAEASGDFWDSWPTLSAMISLVELLDDIDLASIKRIKSSAKDGFDWSRLEAGQILLTLPLTPICAKRIAASAKAKDWLKDVRKFVNPIDLRANDDGLTIALGVQGQPIRFTHEDKRPIRAADESALIKHAGATGPLVIDGKAMTAERLIERFIAEKMQKK